MKTGPCDVVGVSDGYFWQGRAEFKELELA